MTSNDVLSPFPSVKENFTSQLVLMSARSPPSSPKYALICECNHTLFLSNSTLCNKSLNKLLLIPRIICSKALNLCSTHILFWNASLRRKLGPSWHLLLRRGDQSWCLRQYQYHCKNTSVGVFRR